MTFRATPASTFSRCVRRNLRSSMGAFEWAAAEECESGRHSTASAKEAQEPPGTEGPGSVRRGGFLFVCELLRARVGGAGLVLALQPRERHAHAEVGGRVAR